MNKLMTKEQVLEILDIPDFRHVTKDKLITFASMIQDMDPETARMAIEQFPNFSNMALEIMRDYKASMVSLLDNNKAVSEKSIAALNGIIEALKTSCNSENVSFDERCYYIDKMIEVGNMITEIDRENREFNRQSMVLGFIVAVIIPAIAGAILGGNFKIRTAA